MDTLKYVGFLFIFVFCIAMLFWFSYMSVGSSVSNPDSPNYYKKVTVVYSNSVNV